MVEKIMIDMVQLQQLHEQGYTTEKIAEKLRISVATVRTILGSVHCFVPRSGSDERPFVKKCA